MTGLGQENIKDPNNGVPIIPCPARRLEELGLGRPNNRFLVAACELPKRWSQGLPGRWRWEATGIN